jgi:hypothetical protein
MSLPLNGVRDAPEAAAEQHERSIALRPQAVRFERDLRPERVPDQA